MRTELGFWSVLVGTVGVTGTAKVKALQTCLKQALTCGMPLQPPCFGTYPAQARSVTGRLADGEREHGTGGGPHVGRYHRLQTGHRIIGLRRQRERWCNPAVRVASDTVAGGIREQLFTVGDIPGVLWTPAEGSGPRPLELIGHGGGQHKKEPGVLSMTEREAAGEPAGPAWPALCEVIVTEIVPDWQATLDALQKLDCVGDSQPVGYYGLSQGGGVGVHLVAAEPRITAAVLGLDESDVLISIAPRITIPVEFVLQWDDAGHPRDSMLTLFDALGSTEKTLPANPGSHFEVPDFEIDSSIRFFARHLGSQGAAI